MVTPVRPVWAKANSGHWFGGDGTWYDNGATWTGVAGDGDSLAIVHISEPVLRRSAGLRPRSYHRQQHIQKQNPLSREGDWGEFRVFIAWAAHVNFFISGDRTSKIHLSFSESEVIRDFLLRRIAALSPTP